MGARHRQGDLERYASEVAAGLAYLASAGPDAALQDLAGRALLRDELTLPEPVETIEGPFEQRYRATVASGALANKIVIVPDNRRSLAEVGLALFNDTHDFFALHVVTGSHALAVCADAICLDVDGLLNAGVLAVYLTVGAPRFDQRARAAAARIDDEHDAKLAFSCLDQARRLDSDCFGEAAAVYGHTYAPRQHKG